MIMRNMWQCYTGCHKTLLKQHRHDMCTVITKTLGPLLAGYTMKQDKFSLKWSVAQVKVIRPKELFNELLKQGALHQDKGCNSSLMLLPTVDGQPVPANVRNGVHKREREEGQPHAHPRNAPIFFFPQGCSPIPAH